MKKILVIYSARIPSVELVLGTICAFGDKYNVEIVEMPVRAVRKKNIEWADTVLAIRPFEISAHGIIMSAYKSSRQVIIYLDDDLLNLPDVYSSKLRRLFARSMHGRNCSYLRDALAVCDVLWGSSQYLIQKYEGLVLRGRCVCTDICMAFPAITKKNNCDKKRRILFAGSGNHYVHLNKFIIPALNRLSKECQFSLTCVGLLKEYIDDCEFELITYPWMSDFTEYNNFMNVEGFDIGVAPIEQEDFYRCKYFNKFIEYSLHGIVGIYTDDYPYKSVVVDGYNGLLAENNVEGWMNKIKYALVHSDVCEEMVRNAQMYINNRFSLEAQMEQIFNELPELYCTTDGMFLPIKFFPHYLLNFTRNIVNLLVYKYEKNKK